MSVRERITAILDRWFLTSPFYTAIAAIHVFDAISNLGCPIRVRSGHIEVDSHYYDDKSDGFLEESIKIECLRALLRHPYERMLPDAERTLKASNLVISNNLPLNEVHLMTPHDVFGIKTDQRLSMEEYYDMLGDGDKDYHDDGCLSREDAESRVDGWGNDAFQKVRMDNLAEEMCGRNLIGSAPGMIKDMILEKKDVAFDYKAVFRRFRSTLLSSERRLTRMRPSRRFGFDAMGSTRGFTTRLLVAVDTSGSISDDDLSRVLSFIDGMFRYGMERVDVIDFDRVVYEDTLETLTKRHKRLDVTGRGGTSFDDVFRYVGSHYYDGLIIVTDGLADVPSSKYIGVARRTSVLWCLNSRAMFDKMNRTPGFLEFGKTTYFK